jgi:hypothetical protein
MPNVQRSTCWDRRLEHPKTNAVRRRMILDNFSKAMCITALLSVCVLAALCEPPNVRES